jgi:hypothetical protein
LLRNALDPELERLEKMERQFNRADEFYREIAAHPIRADLEAVKVVAGAPAVLDLFMWRSYR